jgi:hypothetical protein
MSTDRRTRLISLAGAALLVVLATTAIAVWLNSGGTIPKPTGEGYWDPFGIGSGTQPGSSASPSQSPSSTRGGSPSLIPRQSPPAGSRSPLKADYKTVALLGLGGFDTEVTVRNPSGVAHTGWTVELTMPSDKAVENRSTAVVKMVQNGTKVVLTPVQPTLDGGKSVTFTVRFPALLALGKAITACTIDGQPCGAG